MQFQGFESIQFNPWIRNSFSKSTAYNSTVILAWITMLLKYPFEIEKKISFKRIFYSVWFNKFISIFLVRWISAMNRFFLYISISAYLKMCIVKNIFETSLRILKFNGKMRRIHCKPNEMLIFVWFYLLRRYKFCKQGIRSMLAD